MKINMFIEIMLWLNVSLLFLHEMDAIFRKEWKMMIVLQNIEDEKAHIIFTAAHVFLYMMILYLVVYQKDIIFWILQPFSIFHLFLHLGFRNHRSNNFKNLFSLAIIYAMALIGIISIGAKLL